jgi:cysteine desulfurase
MRSDTVLVSIMHANNEVGSIQDILTIGEICHSQGILFHTDACQSFGKVQIDVSKIPVDLICFSAHKIHGPTGIGALYVKTGTTLEPIMFGGKQEMGLRSGTYHVEGIVGFGAAIHELKDSDRHQVSLLRDKLIFELGTISGVTFNGEKGDQRLCNNINISLSNHSAKNILLELSKRGIYLSVGSACSSGKKNPSHVLMAMGRDENMARESLRISLSRFTTEREIDEFVRHLREVMSV